MVTSNEPSYASRTIHRWLLPTFAVAISLVAWELVSRNEIVDPHLFPPPTSVTRAFKEWYSGGELSKDIASSCTRLLLGFALGGATGVLVGLLTGRSRLASATLAPLIQLLRPLPPVAIIPLVIVWLGIGVVAKVFSIAFGVFFPVWINTHLGAVRIPKVYLWSARTQGCSWWTIAMRIVFPATLPSIVAGLRTSISIAFVMVFVAELAGASSGIGYQISVSHLAYRIDKMIAALLVLAAVGALVDWLFARAVAWLFPWIEKV